MSCAGISPQVQVPTGDVRRGYGFVVPDDHNRVPHAPEGLLLRMSVATERLRPMIAFYSVKPPQLNQLAISALSEADKMIAHARKRGLVARMGDLAAEAGGHRRAGPS
jgi:hypothetical protein